MTKSVRSERSTSRRPETEESRPAEVKLATPRMEDLVRQEYSRLAPKYDRRWADYVAATTHETVKRLNLRENDRVLDVGCGTGVLLETVGRHAPGAQLTGLDPVAEMLDVARERLGFAVRLVLATAETLPFDSGVFDIVVSNSALHYFTDPKAAIREMHRVLHPGGQVVVTDWRRDHWKLPFLRYYLRARGHACGRVFSPTELRTLLTCGGFEGIEVTRFRAGWCWGLMTADATKRRQES